MHSTAAAAENLNTRQFVQTSATRHMSGILDKYRLMGCPIPCLGLGESQGDSRERPAAYTNPHIKGQQMKFDLVQHIDRQIAFSKETFGPGQRTAGVVDHIRKELEEIEAQPGDLEEWIDVILLAIDGAWREGYTPEQIAAQLAKKQEKNESRSWPDWRTAEPGKAIEHIHEEDD